MASRLRTHKKKTRIETPEYSTAPAPPMFQSRPFVVQSQTAQKSKQPDLKTALMRAERYGHHLSRIQPGGVSAATAVQPKQGMRQPVEYVRTKAPQLLQAKLSVGAPGDMYEQEADAVAAQVVDKMNGGGERSPTQESAQEPEQSQSIQRPNKKSSQRLGLNIQPLVQREAAGGVRNALPHIEQSIEQKRGGGQSLYGNIRKPLERAFGADFSGVKVHTDAQSDQLNQSIQAKAFTTGQDIFFRQGAYDPGSRKGQELISHELTHVVQQSGGAVQRSQPQERREGLQAATSLEGEGAIQCFEPTNSEQPNVDTALNTLLGADNDPGGIRAQLTTKASNLADLRSAITTVVTTAAVPEGDRVGLLNQMGNDVKLLADLLTVATQANNAGTPGLRLSRVLAANPAVPRTLADLTPLINPQKDIDDKILRGKITGGALATNERPNPKKRTLIGGHSPEILNDPSYVIESNVLNPNNTGYIGFRKLLRSDAGAFASAVQNNAPGNLVAAVDAAANIGNTAANAAPALVNQVDPNLASTNPDGFRKATAAFETRLQKRTDILAAVNAAYLQVAKHASDARAAAANAAAHPHSAAEVKPFIDAMTNLFTNANALLKGANQIDPAKVGPAMAALTTAMDSFELTGPVLSAKKNSTIAPDGWTEDQVLGAGDQTAQVPPTLIRQNSTNNNPANGSLVDTKHQKVIDGIVWVVMKEDVTFHQGPPPTFSGGKIISSYPTRDSVIPPDAVHPNKDPDRFSTVP